MATALRPGGRAAMRHARRRDPRPARAGRPDRTTTPGRLSGGQRQRVAIARALVNRPLLVLADEPTAALDAASGAIVMGLLRDLADGPERTTVLIVTHDQRLLDRADRIVNMVGGRIVSSVMPAMTIRILKTISQIEGAARAQRGDPDPDRRPDDRRASPPGRRSSPARGPRGTRSA